MAFGFKSSPNNRKVMLQIEELERLTRRGIRQAFYRVGKDVVASAKKSILDKPKSGKTYIVYRGGRKRVHQSSAPGEAPANLTGTLRRSIDFQVHGSSELEVGAETPYARKLELGGQNLEARPYLISAIDSEERNSRRHFEKEIEKELTRK